MLFELSQFTPNFPTRCCELEIKHFQNKHNQTRESNEIKSHPYCFLYKIWSNLANLHAFYFCRSSKTCIMISSSVFSTTSRAQLFSSNRHNSGINQFILLVLKFDLYSRCVRSNDLLVYGSYSTVSSQYTWDDRFLSSSVLLIQVKKLRSFEFSVKFSHMIVFIVWLLNNLLRTVILIFNVYKNWTE